MCHVLADAVVTPTILPRELPLESRQLHAKKILEFDVETAGLHQTLPVCQSLPVRDAIRDSRSPVGGNIQQSLVVFNRRAQHLLDLNDFLWGDLGRREGNKTQEDQRHGRGTNQCEPTFALESHKTNRVFLHTFTVVMRVSPKKKSHPHRRARLCENVLCPVPVDAGNSPPCSTLSSAFSHRR